MNFEYVSNTLEIWVCSDESGGDPIFPCLRPKMAKLGC